MCERNESDQLYQMLCLDQQKQQNGIVFHQQEVWQERSRYALNFHHSSFLVKSEITLSRLVGEQYVEIHDHVAVMTIFSLGVPCEKTSAIII